MLARFGRQPPGVASAPNQLSSRCPNNGKTCAAEYPEKSKNIFLDKIYHQSTFDVIGTIFVQNLVESILQSILRVMIHSAVPEMKGSFKYFKIRILHTFVEISFYF